MRTRRGEGTLAAALGAALLWAGGALPGATARHVEAGDDTVVEIATRVRYTTVIVVPEDERILTFVCGDSEYWGLEGKALTGSLDESPSFRLALGVVDPTRSASRTRAGAGG